jgi:SAM-dependent methyltransferase
VSGPYGGTASALIAGEEYVVALTEKSSDRRARAAFLAHATQGLAPGATIFDFGCGPGLDAQYYATHGFGVRAYDVDERMCDSFERRCAGWIAGGRVRLMRGAYPAFLDSDFAHGAIDLVTANFAPLNVIADLSALFAKFHALTRPGGRVLASLLNPSCVGDMRYGWWWKNRARYRREGSYAVRGPIYDLRRYSTGALANLASPHFALRAVHRGLPTGAWLRSPLLASLALHTSRFLFFEFARR